MPDSAPLTGAFADDADARLAATDALLASAYPGDDGSRQPVHTVYVPAERFTAATVTEWGEQARAAAESAGGVRALAELVGVADPDAVAVRVAAKLRDEPVEDLRIDFEDGYHGTDEDADAVAAARAVTTGGAPPFVGIRFKSFEAATRRRGLRTLETFLGTLAEAGDLPAGLVLTLPKVTTPEQVAVLTDACRLLESSLGLAHGRLRFELQLETPPMVLAVDGSCPLPTMVQRGGGRVSGVHYGTYDYSDALQIAAGYQSMEHPAADHAKAVMQVALAGTGVRMSDGSTNQLPVGDDAQRRDAWTLHARLVRRSLERGFYQGWDLHPAQLPTRYLATYAFYRDGFGAAARRLRDYVEQRDSAVLDEPATARALARFLDRGLTCGAVDATELAEATGLDAPALRALARPAERNRR